MVALIVAAGVFLFAAVAEWLHQRRVRRIARLAFGPEGRPAKWAGYAPQARVLALTALAWGLTTLMLMDPAVHTASEGIPDSEKKHLLIVLDVSPSMRLVDAGAEGDQSRMHRVRDVLNSLFARVAVRQYLVTVIATYNGAIPVVEKSSDPEVMRNILNDLPMHQAFHKGDTDLFAGLEEAAKVAKPWNPKSATLLLVSDGDSVPPTGMPKMPGSVAHSLVVGVGDPREGSFIDGRHSRQEASMLRQIAIRLGGSYHNANDSHIPSDLIRGITAGGAEENRDRWTQREYALLASLLGAAIFAFLPHLLRKFGTVWRPGLVERSSAAETGNAKRARSRIRQNLEPTGVSPPSDALRIREQETQTVN